MVFLFSFHILGVWENVDRELHQRDPGEPLRKTNSVHSFSLHQEACDFMKLSLRGNHDGDAIKSRGGNAQW